MNVSGTRRGEYSNQMQGTTAGVQEGMRHACGHTRDVRPGDSKVLLPDQISHSASENYVGLFDIMPMQIWAAAGMCFRDDKRKGFEAVVAAVDVIAKLSRWAVE